MPAAESAVAVVVGRIEDRDKIDLHGYAAHLKVERSLLPEASPPSRLRIAWEELARSRKPRFEPGDSVLLALGSLPNASLWDQRFPGARAEGSVLAVAAEGDAYMHNPDAQSLDLLAQYLRFAPDQRQQAPGVEALGQLVATAAPGVAASAVRRLSAIDFANVTEETVRPLVNALTDEKRPLELRRAIVELIEARKVVALRPQLDALAQVASSLQAPALSAVVAIDGGVSAQRATELLSSSDAAVRAIATGFLGADGDERLIRLIKDDAAPEVRGAAAAALVRNRGIDAFADVVPALADTNGTVRLAAVEAVGKLGATAVPQLSALARDGSLDEATGAVLALDQCGAAGKTALIALAADHRDERVRRLALLTLGQLGGHEH